MTLVWIVDDEWKDYKIEKKILREKISDCEIIHSIDEEYRKDFEELKGQVEGIIAQIDVPFPRELIKELSKCKIISASGGGYDQIDVEAAKEKNIWVTRCVGYADEPVSDHALFLILTLARRYPECKKILEKRRRSPSSFEKFPKLVRKSTLAIIGFGGIGKTLAEKAQALGMKVIAQDPYIDKDKMKELGVEKVPWDDAFKKADFVSVHVPLTSETEDSIGIEEFKMMKSDAFLINTARGEVVKEEELIEAVESGDIAGAGLDTIRNEPPELDRPVLNQDNIIVTPHVASGSNTSYRQLKEQSAKNVVIALKGEKPEDNVY